MDMTPYKYPSLVDNPFKNTTSPLLKAYLENYYDREHPLYMTRGYVTPFQDAITNSLCVIIKLYTQEPNFDVHAPMRNKQSPLEWAVLLAKVPCIKLLIEAGADTNQPLTGHVGKAEHSSLLLSICSSRRKGEDILAIVQLLVDGGANVLVTTFHGETAEDLIGYRIMGPNTDKDSDTLMEVKKCLADAKRLQLGRSKLKSARK